MFVKKGGFMKQSLVKRVVIATLAVSMAFAPMMSYACTSFLLRGNDGGYVYGRTMEFGLPLKSVMMSKKLT